MHARALVAYLLVVLVLFLKLVALATTQGRARLRMRTFRWPEDATAFGGRAVDAQDTTIVRAQAALRNDGESQWFFVAGAGAWVALGADPWAVTAVGAAYAASRVAHTVLLLRARQPARSRIFGVGLVIVLGVFVDALRLAIVHALAAG